jgi:hypothetical protein
VSQIKRHHDAIARLKAVRPGSRLSEHATVLDDMRQYPYSLSVQYNGLRAICSLCASAVSTRCECTKENCDCRDLFTSKLQLGESVAIPSLNPAKQKNASALGDPYGVSHAASNDVDPVII